LAVAVFAQRCQDAIRSGQPLDIEHLLVAPVIQRRHASFFDGLTDWVPAARRARELPGQQRRRSHARLARLPRA
jgi:hypothetical protein